MKTEIIKLRDKKNIERLIAILREISDTITGTLGPNGYTAILYDGGNVPHVTKDGVTVAEFLKYDDPFKEAINSIIKETARKTGQDVGDGTTTSILLACKLATSVLNYTGNRKELLKRLSVEVGIIQDFIQNAKVSLDITDKNTFDVLESIINIASNGDKDITELLIDVVGTIGIEGLIDVVISNNTDTFVNVRGGMLIEAPAMLVHRTVTLDKSKVLLIAGSVFKVSEFKSTMTLAREILLKTGKSLVVVAKEFSKEIQEVVNANNRLKNFSMYLVETDGFGPGMLEIMDDMATVLQCKVLSTNNTSPFALQNVVASDLGDLAGAVINTNSTVLYPLYDLDEVALEVKESILEHIHTIKSKGEGHVGELRHVEKRLSKFTKSATISVGGYTEAEKLERKDRVDDAVHAISAAIRGGVVSGAGSTLYRASQLAIHPILVDLCKLPAQTLHENANSSLVLEDIYFKDYATVVIDYTTDTAGNAYTLGILDPADVQIKALEQALAITKTLVNTHVLLIPTLQEWHGMQGG